MISILILTHNRNKLFERCYNSVITALNYSNFSFDVEILVNNDSDDIQEIYGRTTTYSYFKSDTLGEIYKYLFNKSTGDFIFYLEDDDYLVPEFFTYLDLTKDLNFLKYLHADIKETVQNRHNHHLPSKNTTFQLSQLFFRKNMLTEFPKGNSLDNDYVMYQNIMSNKPTVNIINKYCWVQTKDGRDNISDARLNKDTRWNSLSNTA